MLLIPRVPCKYCSFPGPSSSPCSSAIQFFFFFEGNVLQHFFDDSITSQIAKMLLRLIRAVFALCYIYQFTVASPRSHDWQAPSHRHSSLHASTRALARSAQNFAGQCDDSKVDYELDVAAVNVLIACTQRMSVVVNDSPVGPVLHFQEGQTSKIRVRNNVIGNKFIEATDVIMHWHGLDVGPWMDGSPVSQWPIKSGGCFQYEITPKAGSAGSYLYHDHAMKSFAATTVTGAIIVYRCSWKEILVPR